VTRTKDLAFSRASHAFAARNCTALQIQQQERAIIRIYWRPRAPGPGVWTRAAYVPLSVSFASSLVPRLSSPRPLLLSHPEPEFPFPLFPACLASSLLVASSLEPEARQSLNRASASHLRRRAAFASNRNLSHARTTGAPAGYAILRTLHSHTLAASRSDTHRLQKAPQPHRHFTHPLTTDH
jgi:hypothetical protein